MEALKKSGRVRHIGISNVRAPLLRLLLEKGSVKPSFVQNRCLNKNDWDRGVREICALHVITYQPFWLLTGNRDFRSDAATKRIASVHGMTAEQVLFRFAMQEMGLQPLTGTKDLEHMKFDLAVAGTPKFSLDDAELADLRAIKPRPGAEHNGKPVALTFANLLEQTVHLFWKNPDNGALHPQGVLEPTGEGSSTLINSFHGQQVACNAQVDSSSGGSWKCVIGQRRQVFHLLGHQMRTRRARKLY